MEIELKKVKLTKSILAQMQKANSDDLKNKCLGYVVNCRKDIFRAYILTNGHRHSILEGGWRISSDGKHLDRYESPGIRGIEQWADIQKIYNTAIQIYI